MNSNPLEKTIEAAIRKYARSKGVLVYKFTSPAQRHVPDRLLIFKGRVWFMEIKRRGEKATAAQAIEHTKMRANGAVVYVVDSMEAGCRVIDLETLV